MVKPTQTIRRILLTNCLSVFDHFVCVCMCVGGGGDIFIIPFLKVKALLIDTELQRDVSNVMMLT